LAVTTRLTVDLGALPLLWVLPLVVFLLSYIVAFGNLKLARTLAAGAPVALVMACYVFLVGRRLMSPIEMVGKITKPFALAIRLFANMTAGHIVVLALIGLIFTFQSYVIGTAPLLMAVAIMMLELFVAFLQAFIFSLLASVFIGQIREGAH